MPGKFIITADRVRLRIYRYAQSAGQFSPSIQPVDALDLPAATDTRSSGDAASPQGSADRVYPAADATLAPPGERDALVQLTVKMAEFLEDNPESRWDFAAPSALHEAVVELLPPPVRLRLDRVVSKDLVQAPPAALREHFALK